MGEMSCIQRCENSRSFWLYQVALSLFLVFLPFLNVNAQERNKRLDAFVFETTVTGDFVRNFQGGKSKGSTYIGMESLTLLFDFDKADLWKNGTLFLHGLNAHGIGPSESLSGDLQVLSNIEAGDYTGLYEFWYMHQIGKFSVLLGQHDLNSEFAGTRYGGLFINSSFGIGPNLSLNVPVSIYPLATPAFILKYDHQAAFSFKYAIYGGNPGDFETNRYNLKWDLSRRNGFLNIGEIQYNLIKEEKETGIYRFGVYYHTGNFNHYVNPDSTKKGNSGVYFIADQALFSRSLSAARGLCYFVQGGYAPPKYNMVQYYLGGGFRYHGIIPYRYYDEIGIAFAFISLSDFYKALSPNRVSNETSLEMTYKFQFSKRYSIQPSFQYIINPGANNYNDDCLVGLLRFTLSY
jgi:porin